MPVERRQANFKRRLGEERGVRERLREEGTEGDGEGVRVRERQREIYIIFTIQSQTTPKKTWLFEKECCLITALQRPFPLYESLAWYDQSRNYSAKFSSSIF